MHIIGSVIKKGLELRAQFDQDKASPIEAQRDQLRKVLDAAKDTAIGKYYDFKGILEAPDCTAEYQRRVPLMDYDTISENWWKQTLQYPDITWPGKPDFFAKSSGTTGREPKRIPVTEAMLDSIRKVSISQLTSISNFDLPRDFFEREMMALSSSTSLEKVNDHQEGEISAITASNIPFWFEGIYRPGKEIAGISDWDERVEKIAQEAPKWNIGALSGIPSWILLMLKRIIEYHNLETIHDIWPGLKVYTSGGVAFEPYRAKFEQLFREKVHIMDTYLSSEGFMAYNCRPHTMSMKMALDHGLFFEFIPFDKRGFDEYANLLEEPEVHLIHQVEEGTDYALIITSTAGNYRYLIGDTVKFTDAKRCEILITGRTKHFLNVVGSQLSESKMDDATQHLQEALAVNVEEFTVSAVEDEQGDFYHEWVLGVEENEGANASEIAEELDRYLCESNKNYEVARRKALHGVKVHPVSMDRFYEWHARTRKKGGQVKTKKVMDQKDFVKFRDFVLQQ